MEKSYTTMKLEHCEMSQQNTTWRKAVDSIKEQIKEVQIENEKRREESIVIEKQFAEITAESAYFKDLLEKGIQIRKELELKSNDEKTQRIKAEEQSSASKLAVCFDILEIYMSLFFSLNDYKKSTT